MTSDTLVAVASVFWELWVATMVVQSSVAWGAGTGNGWGVAVWAVMVVLGAFSGAAKFVAFQ